MISETMICCQPSLAPPLLARRGRRTSHSFGASHMMFLLVGEYSFTPGCQTDVHYIWRVLFERESTTHPAWKIEYSAANQHKISQKEVTGKAHLLMTAFRVPCRGSTTGEGSLVTLRQSPTPEAESARLLASLVESRSQGMLQMKMEAVRSGAGDHF